MARRRGERETGKGCVEILGAGETKAPRRGEQVGEMKSFFTGALSLRASGASKKGVEEEVRDVGGSHQGGAELPVLGWLSHLPRGPRRGGSPSSSSLPGFAGCQVSCRLSHPFSPPHVLSWEGGAGAT